MIKGSEAQQIVLASMVMDKKEHNELLRQVLKQAENVKEEGNRKDEPVRVMIVGSGVSPMDFMELLENMGAEVVVEDHCLGPRYFWDKEQGTHMGIMRIPRKLSLPTTAIEGPSVFIRSGWVTKPSYV